MIVAFTGPYGDNNFGDYMMLVNNLLDFLSQNRQISGLVVFSYEKENLEAVLRKYIPDTRLEIICIESLIEYENCVSEKFEIRYKYPQYDRNGILSSVRNLSEVDAAVSSVDVMVLSGGGCMNYYWLADHRLWKLYSIITPLILAKKYKKKCVTMANTFGPFGKADVFFREFFKDICFDSLCVRDLVYSRKELSSIGISDDIYDSCDDFAIVKNIQVKKKLEKREYFVLELYCSIEDIKKYAQFIETFAKKIKRDSGYDMFYLPIAPGFGGEKQGQCLYGMLGSMVKLEPINGFAKFEDVEEIIRGAKFVICDRYHLFVRSIMNKIACIQWLRMIDGSDVYYRNKCVGFLESLYGTENKADFDKYFTTDSLVEILSNDNSFYEKINFQKTYLTSTEQKDIDRIRSTYIHDILEVFSSNTGELDDE